MATLNKIFPSGTTATITYVGINNDDIKIVGEVNDGIDEMLGTSLVISDGTIVEALAVGQRGLREEFTSVADDFSPSDEMLTVLKD